MKRIRILIVGILLFCSFSAVIGQTLTISYVGWSSIVDNDNDDKWSSAELKFKADFTDVTVKYWDYVVEYKKQGLFNTWHEVKRESFYLGSNFTYSVKIDGLDDATYDFRIIIRSLPIYATYLKLDKDDYSFLGDRKFESLSDDPRPPL